MSAILSAFQFLTVLPIRRGTAAPAAGAVFFPVVGAAIALLAWLIPDALWRLAFLVVITGGIHEDGLADVADAVRAGRTPEKILAVMKDSHIGAYAALALIFSVLMRWQALQHVTLAGLIAAEVLSRSALVLLAFTSKPAGAGLGAAFCGEIRGWAVALVVLQAGIAAGLCGWRTGAILAGLTAAVVLILRLWFHARVGGVTGDCLGATQQVTEIVCLRASSW